MLLPQACYVCSPFLSHVRVKMGGGGGRQVMLGILYSHLNLSKIVCSKEWWRMSNSLISKNNEFATSYVVGTIVSNLQAETNGGPQLLSTKTMETWKIGYAYDQNASQSQQEIVVEEAGLHSRIDTRGSTQVSLLNLIRPYISQLPFFHIPYALNGFDYVAKNSKRWIQ